MDANLIIKCIKEHRIIKQFVIAVAPIVNIDQLQISLFGDIKTYFSNCCLWNLDVFGNADRKSLMVVIQKYFSLQGLSRNQRKFE